MSVFEAERRKSKVDGETLRKIVYREDYIYKNFKEISKVLQKAFPTEDIARFHELSRPEQIKYSYRVLAELVKAGIMNQAKHSATLEMYFLTPFEISGGVSTLMVKSLIDTLCSDEQKAYWIPLFNTSRVIGAYAQTELGHGSDVQSLETEAVFDEKTKQFVINSPTVSSMKWWPGELANIANIAIVYAKTIIKGRKIGVLPFIVQIRDFETHKPMPGVEVGDIGPKMGYSAKENGYLRLDHVRVPVTAIPSRFMEVTAAGDVVQKGNPKIIYTAMMKSRTALLGAAAISLGKAVAIATRYSFLRKQFKNDKKEEVPVIQYQLQRYKLFPLLAKSYVIQGATTKILEIVKQCDLEVANGRFENLQETHVLLSGGKVYYTWWCINGLNVCMQCCGGHGYSQYSGIPSLIQNFAPNTILEGENTMLSLQVGRHLLKNYRYVTEGRQEKLHGYCSFFKDMDRLLAFNTAFDSDLLSGDNLKALWQRAVLAKVTDTVEAGVEHSANHSMLDTFNKKIGIHVFECAKLFSILFTFDFFNRFVTELKHAETKRVFQDLGRLFIIELTLECAGILLPMKILSAEQLRVLQKEFERLLDSLFPDALVLAEGWILDDYTLHSAIANSNEKPYENLYNLAKTSGILNKTDLTGVYLDTVRRASLEAYPEPKL